MKFVLFCEGHTERKALPAFLKRWLDPRLSQPPGMQAVRFDGWAELLKDAPRKARLYLHGPGCEQVLGVIGLVDLHGPTVYPGGLDTAADREQWLREHVEKQVDEPKFRMFCAVHEIEAWLLSQPELLPGAVAQALPGGAAKPEAIDFDTPPSHLLDRLYREKTGRGYKKVVYGADLFSKLDPEAARAKCPFFAQLLDELLAMAQAAGL